MKPTLIPLLLLLLLMGCSNSPQQIKQYYRLTNTTNNTEQSATDSQKRNSLLISQPEALSILGGRPMVATRDDGALVQLNHHYWLDSPKILLQDRLLSWAQQHWQNVLISPEHSDAKNPERLQTRILAFEKNQNQAHIELEFTLYDAAYNRLLSKTFDKSQPLNGNNFADFAQTVNQLITDILSELSQSLTEQP